MKVIMNRASEVNQEIFILRDAALGQHVNEYPYVPLSLYAAACNFLLTK